MDPWPRRGSFRIGAPTCAVGSVQAEKEPRARVAFEAWQEASAAVDRTGFVRIFEVALEHAYYNAGADHRCPGFDVYPNARTITLMRSLGMMFRNEGTSFSVLYDQKRLDVLSRYLDRDRWAHLSFFLAAKAGRLVNVTDMALEVDAQAHNFYFRSDEAVRVSPGARPPLTIERPHVCTTRLPHPVRPARFHVDVPPKGSIELADLAGTVFLRVDLADPASSLGATAIGPPVYLDLSRTAEGYNLLTVKGPGGEVLLDRWPFIYTIADPSPLCYLHVMLCEPRPGMGGVYPIALAPGAAEPIATITPTHFRFRFGARSARWAYHVFSSLPLESFTSLSIAPAAPDDPAVPAFSAWEREVLPNGREAARIESLTALPLQQRSSLRLQLRGRVRGGEERVLVDRLPVASADQVPRRDEAGDVLTDIYVHL